MKPDFDFDTLWGSGAWRKLGRAEAKKRFQVQIKTEKDWRDIQAARDAYNEHCRRERKWYTPQLGSTWFGARKGWRDWIPDLEVEARSDDPLFAEDWKENSVGFKNALEQVRQYEALKAKKV